MSVATRDTGLFAPPPVGLVASRSAATKRQRPRTESLDADAELAPHLAALALRRPGPYAEPLMAQSPVETRISYRALSADGPSVVDGFASLGEEEIGVQAPASPQLPKAQQVRHGFAAARWIVT